MVTIIPTIPPNHPFRFGLETGTYMKACGNQAVGGYGEGNKAVNRRTGPLEESRVEGDFWACIIPEGQKKKKKKKKDDKGINIARTL